MRTICLLAICSLVIDIACLGQKPSIDSAEFGKWPAIKVAKISNDGKYSLYTVSDGNTGSLKLSVVSNTDKWRFDEHNIHPDVDFSNDSRSAYFRTAGDSLAILQLGTASVRYIPCVSSFERCPNGDRKWIAFQASVSKKLSVWDLNSGEELDFWDAQRYEFSHDGKSMLITSIDSGRQIEILNWVDLSNGKMRLSWNGLRVGSYVLDESHAQLAFVGVGLGGDKQETSLYYYRVGMDSAKCLYSGSQAAKDGLTVSDGQLGFSRSGGKLLFPVSEPIWQGINVKENGGGVTVWNYKDSVLQSVQKATGIMRRNDVIWEVLDIANAKVMRLNNINEKLDREGGFEDYLLVEMYANDLARWQKHFALYLLSTRDGTRRTLFDSYYLEAYTVSPDEHFVIWFDPERLEYIDYEISTGITRSIGTSIPVPLYSKQDVDKNRRNANYGVLGWSGEDHSVFLYDEYDIWKVDLLGKEEPVNVTQGYGRAHNLVFSQIKINEGGESAVELSKKVLMSAFNINTKENGLFETDREFIKDFTDISVSPYTYFIGRTGSIFFDHRPNAPHPIRAKDREVFLFERMNASEYPNLFVTADFKHFKQISFLCPEKKYNWIRSKLISWRKLDGQLAQGILYLPEDFDSTKKYPVIFECYEKMSNNLNNYLEPDVCYGRIDIPYYVSNHYLVFEPDIIWKVGATGQGVLNSVVSAVKYLSKFSWVDSTKIGLQGHSFGGWVANYVATHTTVFAAVCAAAGISDQISGYGELLPDGSSYAIGYELGQIGAYGVGVTPWTNPKVYMDNSALFNLESASTPLLLVQGTQDEGVPCAQSVELYLAMRRAGKKVWFLEYEGAGHILFGANALDFTIRMKQFFDHYLKDSAAPLWMTKGVPYAERGDGWDLQLDLSGQQP